MPIVTGHWQLEKRTVIIKPILGQTICLAPGWLTVLGFQLLVIPFLLECSTPDMSAGDVDLEVNLQPFITYALPPSNQDVWILSRQGHDLKTLEDKKNQKTLNSSKHICCVRAS